MKFNQGKFDKHHEITIKVPTLILTIPCDFIGFIIADGHAHAKNEKFGHVANLRIKDTILI